MGKNFVDGLEKGWDCVGEYFYWECGLLFGGFWYGKVRGEEVLLVGEEEGGGVWGDGGVVFCVGGKDDGLGMVVVGEDVKIDFWDVGW